jgi:microcystin-dependent protein
MSCSNCFNGCSEIVSDQCVRYTGIDIPLLGIKNGDSLSYVEQALIEFLTSTLDGTGIIVTIPQESYCEVVSKYLPDCGEITVPVLFEALIKAACDLQVQIDGIDATLATLNANYTIGCLTGVTPSSDTHDIVQAVITKLCQVNTSLAALQLDVENNYVQLADIDAIIANYLATNAPTNKLYNKMVPYTAIPYFGSIVGNFDLTGAGLPTTIWEDIYLCNGLNGTPDLRGRVLVAVTTGMGGGPYNPAVDPASNPNYSINSLFGNNYIALSPAQMPVHTHTAVATVIEPNSGQGHRHNFEATNNIDGGPRPKGFDDGNSGGVSSYQTDFATTGIAVNVTNSSTGGGGSHINFQPGIGCYYIMYIP